MAIKLEGGKTREDDCRYVLNTASAPGIVVVHTGSGGSGIGETGFGEVAIPPTGGAVSGYTPAGMLFSNVVDQDVTRFPLNEQKNEVLIGYPCTLIKKGFVYTDKLTGTPTDGVKAYLHRSGNVSPTDLGSAPQVGKFGGQVDANGFVALYLNIV